MKFQAQPWSWQVFMCSLFLLLGCQENKLTGPGENPANSNLFQVIQSSSDLNTLESLLEGTSLQTLLDGHGTLTIFAPTDAAFQKLPAGYLESLSHEQKVALLEYHAYEALYRIQNEIKREPILTLQGDPLFIEIGQSYGNLINNRAKFVDTNAAADNGLLHTIDEVLIPDQMGTLFDNISKRYEFKNFSARLSAADLRDLLNAAGTKTLLTTNDVALDWYVTGEGLTFTDEEWKEIMQYHVLEIDFTESTPGTKIALPTVHGDSVYLVVDLFDEFLINGGGGSLVQQVFATNGKIVLPSGLMLPDKFIGVLTIMDKRFNQKTFRSALAQAGMTGRLYNSEGNGDEKFTIFVPEDNATGIHNLPSDEAELSNVLKYHILLDQFNADELQHNQNYTTWQGSSITITKNGSQLFVNGTAMVKQPQVIGNNGVVYFIDQVLTPPAN